MLTKRYVLALAALLQQDKDGVIPVLNRRLRWFTSQLYLGRSARYPGELSIKFPCWAAEQRENGFAAFVAKDVMTQPLI